MEQYPVHKSTFVPNWEKYFSKEYFRKYRVLSGVLARYDEYHALSDAKSVLKAARRKYPAAKLQTRVPGQVGKFQWIDINEDGTVPVAPEEYKERT